MSHALGSGWAHIWHFSSYWSCTHSLAWPLPPRQGHTSCQNFLAITFSTTELTRLQPQRLNYGDSRNQDPFFPSWCCFSMIRKAPSSPGPHLHITTPTFVSNSSPQMPFPSLFHSNAAHRWCSDSANLIAWVCIQVFYLLTMWPWIKYLAHNIQSFSCIKWEQDCVAEWLTA